jgi:hypothetical protein
MLALELIAERKIDEAAARGDLQGLPDEGKPLDLYEDPLVPEEMRMARRILKNADIDPKTLMRDFSYEGCARSALLLTTE